MHRSPGTDPPPAAPSGPRTRPVIPSSVALLALLAVGRVPAAEPTGLLDLSLEDLVDVPVASAGLSPSPLRGVPALADVLTCEQLRAHGVATLGEAIALLPGVRLQQRQTFTSAYASVLGASVNDNDNHLLLLVDGVPWRVSSSGGANRLLYEGFPVALVERIEFVRGQAAIVHGSNAVSGAINIVTREPGREPARLVVGMQGGDPVGFAEAGWGDAGRGLTVHAGRHAAWRDWVQRDFAIGLRNGGFRRTSGTMAQSADSLGMLGRWGSMRAQVFAMSARSTTPSSLQFGRTYVPPTRDRSTALRLQDVRPVGSWRLHAALASDRTTLAYDTLRAAGDRQSLRLAVESPSGGGWHGFAGVQAAWAGGRVEGVVPTWRSREWGAFAQVYASLAPDLQLGFGLQHQRVADGAGGTTPQASLVWSPDGPWRLKLMRGESFRDADARERFSSAPFQRGNAMLRPEQGRIDALELGWTGDALDGIVRVFDQRIEDLIVLAPDALGRLAFTNRGHVRIGGTEVQLRWAAGEWRWDSAWRHLSSARDTQAPRDVLKLQGTWSSGTGWRAGLSLEAARAAPTGSRLQAPRPVLNPAAAGYLLVHGHVAAPIARWWTALPDGSTLSLRVGNLGDRELWQPTAVPPINTVPFVPPREWRLLLEMPL